MSWNTGVQFFTMNQTKVFQFQRILSLDGFNRQNIHSNFLLGFQIPDWYRRLTLHIFHKGNERSRNLLVSSLDKYRPYFTEFLLHIEWKSNWKLRNNLTNELVFYLLKNVSENPVCINLERKITWYVVYWTHWLLHISFNFLKMK